MKLFRAYYLSKTIFLFCCFSIIFYSCNNKNATAEEQLDPIEVQIHEWIDKAIQLEDVNIDSAAFYYLKAGDLADSVDSYWGKIRFAYNYSVVLNQKGEYLASEKVNRKALELALQKDDTINIAKGYNNVANTFNSRSMYDTAYVYYLQSAAYFNKANSTQHLCILYSNIGTVLSDMERLEEAIDYYNKALLLAQEANDSLYIFSVLNNKGIALSLKKHNDAAMAAFKEALPYAQRFPQSFSTAQLYSNYANTLKQTGQLDSALLYYQKYYDLSILLGNKAGQGIALQGMAMVYFKMKNYKKAEEYSQKASSSQTDYQYDNTLSLFKLKADISYYTQAYDSSYFYFVKYIELRDTIQQLEIQKTISQAEKKFQLALKEEELLNKELELNNSQIESKKKSWYLLISTFFVAAFGIISYFSYRYIKQRNKLFEAERINLQKDKEISVMLASFKGAEEERFRIAKELHDDLGTELTSIRFLTEKMIHQSKEEQQESNQKVQLSIKGLIEQMNEIVWSMNAESNSLEELILYIRSKIGLILNENNLEYQFEIPNEVPDIELSGFYRRNVYLMVKEAIHNAIKHSKATQITIKLAFSPDLKITVIDNGIGFDEDVIKTGNGLKNMKQRVKSLQGSLKMTNNKGTNIEFIVPYSKY